MYHEILEHRWYLSEARGSDVGVQEAARSYAEKVLEEAPGGADAARARGGGHRARMTCRHPDRRTFAAARPV